MFSLSKRVPSSKKRLGLMLILSEDIFTDF